MCPPTDLMTEFDAMSETRSVTGDESSAAARCAPAGDPAEGYPVSLLGFFLILSILMHVQAFSA